MALTAADRAEIQKMISRKPRRKETKPRGPRKATTWDKYFRAAIKEAKKEYDSKGGDWRKISAKYVKRAKADYNKAKK